MSGLSYAKLQTTRQSGAADLASLRLCMNRTDLLWKVTSLQQQCVFIMEQTKLSGMFRADWILFASVYFFK
jgi:hypothetical protein